MNSSAEWLSSSACESSACVQVAVTEDSVMVRGSESPGEVLYFTPEEWAAFLKGAARGEFDL